MDSKELLKKVRQVEIKSRRLSDNVFWRRILKHL
ncbi:MAG: hypothetical protein CM15mP102_19330 [Flavobacteriales bacterium]|nr:MAG: hypothetical protein CM15mP102_19330 [Flavobacteriales bacterium]